MAISFAHHRTLITRLGMAGFAVVIIAGGVSALHSHAHLTIADKSQSPTSTLASASPTPPPTASATPAVAGAATIAPHPSSDGPPTKPLATSGRPAGTPSVSAAPQAYVTLQLQSGSLSNYNVPFTSGLNACSILTAAKSAGKIKSVTLIYYSSYQSYYVSEINGQSNGWTFKYNGTSPPVGCSKVPLKADDTVTWSYQ